MVPRKRAYLLSSSSENLQCNGSIGRGNSNSKLKSPRRYNNLTHGMPDGFVDFFEVSSEEINLNWDEKEVLAELRNIHGSYNLPLHASWRCYNSKIR